MLEVKAGTQAASKGVRPGWVVCRLNGKVVASGNDVPNLRTFADCALVIDFKAPIVPVVQSSTRVKVGEEKADRDMSGWAMNPLRLRQRRDDAMRTQKRTESGRSERLGGNEVFEFH